MPSRVCTLIAALFVLGAGLILLSQVTRGCQDAARRGDWIKYTVYVFVISGLLLAAWLGREILAGVLLVLAILGTIEIRRILRPPHRFGICTIAFAGLIVCLGHLLLGAQKVWLSSFSTMLLLVAATDSYSQLWGRLLGRRKLCPHLSPNKTIEGFLGGLVTALVVALLLGSRTGPGWTVRFGMLGIVTASAATGGDLAFSWVKRRSGVKDFSRLLPGHGGVLDRFDSLIVAAPVYYWVRTFLFG